MSKLINLSGKRFGFWVVQQRANNSKNGQVQWLCRCECNQEKIVTANSLRTGNSTSCGCNHTPDLTNVIFGKLTVIQLSDTKNKIRRFWDCKCDCGNIITVSTYKLVNLITASCGHETKILKEKLSVTNAIECFIKILIPYNDFKHIVKEARVVYDQEKPNLLVDIGHDRTSINILTK